MPPDKFSNIGQWVKIVNTIVGNAVWSDPYTLDDACDRQAEQLEQFEFESVDGVPLVFELDMNWNDVKPYPSPYPPYEIAGSVVSDGCGVRCVTKTMPDTVREMISMRCRCASFEEWKVKAAAFGKDCL